MVYFIYLNIKEKVGKKMKKKYLFVTILCIIVFLYAINIFIHSVKKDTKNDYKNNVVVEKLDYSKQNEWRFVSGKMQSPVNIITTEVETTLTDDKGIKFNQQDAIKKVTDTGVNIKVTGEGEASINGRTFRLDQFHFHITSEHTINGQYFPMEIHYVNIAQDGRIAVIAVLLEEGEKSTDFEEILQNIDNEKIDFSTKSYSIMPDNHSYYHYIGSLTTPPLSENVEWYIMKNSVEISGDQLNFYKKLYTYNNRDIQPLNNRLILDYTE